jgi:hypothetical protein
MVTPRTRANGLGAISKLDLENQVEEVAAAFGLKSNPNAALIFDSSVLPPRSERTLAAAKSHARNAASAPRCDRRDIAHEWRENPSRKHAVRADRISTPARKVLR